MNHKNEVTLWSRVCPKCGGVVYHQSQKDRDRREHEGRTCGGKANEDCKTISQKQRKKLSKALTGMKYSVRRGTVDLSIAPKWTRHCPNCNKVIEYRGKRHHYLRAKKESTVCNACAKILSESRMCDIMANSPSKVRKMRATKAGFSSWAEYRKLYPKWKQYKASVWSITYKSLRQHPQLEHWHKRGKCGVEGAYQIDHVISIRHGFDNNTPPEQIGAYANLRMIPWKENLLKG